MVVQTVILVLIAAGIGVGFGWFLRGRFAPIDMGEADALARQLATAKAEHARCEAELARLRLSAGDGQTGGQENALPAYGLSAPKGPADDLKRIGGVGPVLEKKLNGFGIYHYAQIASLTEADIAKIDAHLNFKGRIQRDNWIAQAKALASGETTDFARRYDKN